MLIEYDADILKNQPAAIRQIAKRIIDEKRITPEQGIILYKKANLSVLGMLANLVRERKNGHYTYFNRNFHIEPTNICVFDCKFCSYSRLLKHRQDGWEMSDKEILEVVRSYKDSDATEVHIVGGVHPKMGLKYFGNLIKQIKAIKSDLHVKAFTAVELDYMIRKAGVSVEEGLTYLKDCGQESMPGGGAEIFDETLRKQICADKCSADQWLQIHETAHKIGMPSNATILYGHIETYEHRIDHLNRLRNLQDKTGGFMAFIPLKFRNKDNQMSDVREVSMIEDLRNYAVSRIFLDNFDHIKAYWPMIGKPTAQLSQAFGVDDLDGTIDDTTKIYSMAGAEEQSPVMTTDEIIALIAEAKRLPAERDTVYNIIKDYKASTLPV